MKARFFINILMSLVILAQSLSPVLSARAQELPPTETPVATEVIPTGTPTATDTPSATETQPVIITETETPTATNTAAPSVTATATATNTTIPATGTLVASSTPAASNTPSATPSPVITTLPTLPPANGENFTISLGSSPVYAKAGGQAQLKWSIAPARNMSGYELGFVFGKGVQPAASEKSLTFHAADGSYRAPATFTGPIKLEISADAIAPFSVQVGLLKNGLVQTTASLEILEKQDVKAGQEQSVTGLNGQVKVTFKKGSLSKDVSIFVQKPITEEMPPSTLSGEPFQLNAYVLTSPDQPIPSKKTSASQTSLALQGDAMLLADAPAATATPAGPEEVTQFGEAVEIQVKYDDAQYINNESQLHLYWYNTETEMWEILPSYADPETNTLYALTTHFTIFDKGVNDWQAAQMPTTEDWQVSKYTGAVSYSLPIIVPPGPGGLSPKLSLGYGSQSIDQSSAMSQAPWVGMGWNLAEYSIQRVTNGTDKLEDDFFSLSVEGVSSTIYPITIGGVKEYHLQDENFWKITKDGASNSWTVYDKSGNQYYFAAGADMVTREGSEFKFETHRWNLARMENIHGQRIKYTYATETKNLVYGYAVQPVTTATYPETILYANDQYRVRFIREARNDYLYTWTGSAGYNSFMRSRLKSILVEKRVGTTGGVYDLIREYRLSYAADTGDARSIWPGVTWPNGTTSARTATLVSIQQFGKNGASFPAITFKYGDRMHLTEVNNGYGAKITFAYEQWVDSAHVAPSKAWVTKFGYAGFDCSNGNSSSWGDPCEDVNHQGGGSNPLIVSGSAIRVLQDRTYLRPGSAYRFRIYTTATNTQVGIDDGTSQNLVNGKDVVYTLPATANKANPVINVLSGTASVTAVQYWMVPSIYRVTSKSVYDGHGHTYTYTYSYNGATTNTDATALNVIDPSQPALCPDIDPLTSNTDVTCANFNDKYSEFRGHRFVTETAPNGMVTKTEYYQDDLYRGREKTVNVTNANGDLFSKTIHSYEFSALPAPALFVPNGSLTLYGRSFTCQPGNCDYHGLYRYWVRDSYSESHTYTTELSGAVTDTLSQTFNTYESTYGNLIKVTSAVDGAITETTTDYYPNVSGGLWLVGLPARNVVRSCIAVGNCTTVLSVNETIYDANTRFNQVPTTGIVTASRTVAGAQFIQTGYGYDSYGNQTSVTTYDAYGTISGGVYTVNGSPSVVTTTYDSTYHAYPISTTDAMGYKTWSIYDPAWGVVIAQKTQNGAIAALTYDDLGRITSVMYHGDVTLTKAGGGDPFTAPVDAPVMSNMNPSMTMDYISDIPFQTRVTQRVGNGASDFFVTRTYDGMGRQYQQQTGYLSASSGPIVVSTVDTLHDSFTKTRQSQPYAAGETIYYTTTESILESAFAGQTSKVTAPDGSISWSTSRGLLSISTDALGRQTVTRKDGRGNVISVTPPTGPAVGYNYDLLNRMTFANRGGASTQFLYNSFGRKYRMIDSDMGTWNYTYNASGQMDTQTDARGCVLTMSYNDNGLLTGKSSSGAGCGTQVSASYGYNNMNQRTSASSNGITTTWQYDLRGQVTREDSVIDNVTYTTLTSYNNAGMPTTMEYPDHEVLTYTYDNRMMLDKLTSLQNTAGYLQDAVYDTAGRLTSRLLGNGLTQAYTYNPWNVQGGRLKKIQTGTLQDLTYTYDVVGNITKVVDAAGSETQDYTYDSLDRLTTWKLGNVLKESYDYNPTTGNLDLRQKYTSTGTADPAQTGDLVYADAAHAHAASSMINGDGTTNTYIYDANGNQTQRNIGSDTILLAYDAENRVVSVTKNSVVVAQFTYDADGKRVKSTENGVTTTFISAGYEKQGSQITKHYFAGTTRIATRKYVIPQTTTLEYVLTDHINSTALTTDTSGAWVSRIRYTPWGEVRQIANFDYLNPALTSNPAYTLSRYTYTGQYSHMDDPSTSATEGFGLMFYNARWYDPSLGRFAQADSIIPQSQGTQAWDRYAGMNNNPVRYNDPSGHCMVDGHEMPDSSSACQWAMAHDVDQEDMWRKAKELAKNDSFIYTYWKKLLGSGRWGHLMAIQIVTNNVTMQWGECDEAIGCVDTNNPGVLNLVKPDNLMDANNDRYVAILAHEGYHATYGAGNLNNTKQEEYEAYFFEIQVRLELGADMPYVVPADSSGNPINPFVQKPTQAQLDVFFQQFGKDDLFWTYYGGLPYYYK